MDGRTSTSVFESPASGAATPEARSGARQPASSPATPGATHGRLTIDPARLAAWLQPHLPELGGAALHVQALDGGQSNPSWVLQAADRRWVLRAKPGPAAELPRSAHAIEREFEVMSVLRLAGFPV
ncbi:MAG: phosphotransferase, partial [Ottowia sp.]|nr:phosphotransferase [Ottowia sp.]